MTPRIHHHVSIVLLAAGGATRFGSAKQVIDIDGVAMVRHCARNALKCAAVVVVTGAHREKVDDEFRDLDVTLVHNADWNIGMGSSIACGIGLVAQNPAAEAAIILLADQPLVSADDLRELISQHRKQPDCIIAASANGVIMAPCLFPRRFFQAQSTRRARDPSAPRRSCRHRSNAERRRRYRYERGLRTVLRIRAAGVKPVPTTNTFLANDPLR